MKKKSLVVLDAISVGLLAIWLGLAVAHFIFSATLTVFHIDIAAWIAFGMSLLLSGLPRWLHEIADTEIIGPFRLWVAAGATALILCMASTFIATPKMKAIRRIQSVNQNMSAQQHDSLVRDYTKVNNFSVQFLIIRAVLAAGMALGLKKLPYISSTSH
ncbi:MAG: hypothetical protein LBB40_00710 [Holophagales bacterium]|jgi:uncharacterized membrane protein|nr:hypothetical protein [Holophagales bacterium]